MATREFQLQDLYDRAIALTERQGQAIAQGDWEGLARLLAERGTLLEQAETLLGQAAPPANHAELTRRIHRMQDLDEQNEAAIATKQKAVRHDLAGLSQSKVALQGYLGAIRGVVDPRFMDLDR